MMGKVGMAMSVCLLVTLLAVALVSEEKHAFHLTRFYILSP